MILENSHGDSLHHSKQLCNVTLASHQQETAALTTSWIQPGLVNLLSDVGWQKWCCLTLKGGLWFARWFCQWFYWNSIYFLLCMFFKIKPFIVFFKIFLYFWWYIPSCLGWEGSRTRVKLCLTHIWQKSRQEMAKTHRRDAASQTQLSKHLPPAQEIHKILKYNSSLLFEAMKSGGGQFVVQQ